MAIKRLKNSSSQNQKRYWIDTEKPDYGVVFAPRTPLSELVVLIDAELIRDPAPSPYTEADQFNQEGLLSGLLLNKFIRCYRYSDDGPPPEVEPDYHVQGQPIYKDWAILQPAVPGYEGRCAVFSRGENQYALGGIFGNAMEVAANDTRTDAYTELTSAEAEKRRRSDALAAQVADQGVDADIYVSRRPYLMQAKWVTHNATICSPEEALTLVSLYLRRQGEFVVAQMDQSQIRMNQGTFMQVATRELLPESWRWFAACVQHSSGSGDDRLGYLAQSLLQRFGRALVARDRVHIARNQPTNHDLMDEALSDLDQVLLLLMGVVDITARVAHRVLKLSEMKLYRAGWQHAEWRSKVDGIAPALAAVVAPGTSNSDVLTILRLLRNSVHGSALQGMAIMHHGEKMQHFVGLPREDEKDLLEAMDRLGGRSAWSIRQLSPGQNYFEPETLVDLLFEDVIDLLNELMKQTPVECLDHVDIQPSHLIPPTTPTMNSGGNSYEKWIRDSIRWQLGF